MANRWAAGRRQHHADLARAATQTAFGTVPRMKAYPVAGVFDVGMYEYDNSFIFMPLAQAQIYFRYARRRHRLEVLVDDPDDVPGACAA